MLEETAKPSTPSRFSSLAPGLNLLLNYNLSWLRLDIVAGITLAAYLLPAGIGDASLAGLPPQAGIYACLFSGLVFWIFCSSRHTAITVTSAISLLVGSSLGSLAGGDVSRFAALAACTALMVAAIAFLAWLVRAGSVVNFISETVLLGFKAGVALYLASTQLPKFFGFKGGEGNFWQRSAYFFSHIPQTNKASLLLGLGALSLLIIGKKFFKNRPVSIVVVVGGIVVASVLGLDAYGVKMLGEVPQGLPPLKLPAVQASDFNQLLPLALACFMLGAVETAAIGRMFATKHRYRFDSNQEFLAIATANLAAGLGQGFPVSGGMSQSLVNEGSNAKSPLSGLIAAGIILLVTVFFASTLRNLPQPVLAAIVLFAVAGLFKVSELRHLFKADRAEFVVAMAALIGVLGSGLLRGVMIGAVISLIQLLRRTSKPHVAFLGRIPGIRRFSDLDRNPDNESIHGALIFRVEASLLYYNIEHVRETVLKRINQATELPKLVLCDLSNSPHVDIQSAQVLGDLVEDLHARGISMAVVEARSSVRDRLRAEGLDEKLGGINRFRSVAEVIEDFEKRKTQQSQPRPAR